MRTEFDQAQLQELLYQALETELGGVKIYEKALQCAMNADLHDEWNEYLSQTHHHVEVLTMVFEKLGLDKSKPTPGRKVVANLGAALVATMDLALSAGNPVAAELVACECVVLAETKDHANWELLGHVAKHGQGRDETKVLQAAYDEVEQDEDHHLYHTQGWCRELWLQSLGFEAVLPPPEEVKQVESAIGASRAEQAREEML